MGFQKFLQIQKVDIEFDAASFGAFLHKHLFQYLDTSRYSNSDTAYLHLIEIGSTNNPEEAELFKHLEEYCKWAKYNDYMPDAFDLLSLKRSLALNEIDSSNLAGYVTELNGIMTDEKLKVEDEFFNSFLKDLENTPTPE